MASDMTEKRWLQSLDTPLKRLGFSVLVFGCILMVVGLVAAEPYKWWYFWDHLNDFLSESISFSYGRYEALSHRLFAFGFYLMLTGLAMSFLYDKTFGRLVSWIAYGRKN